MINIWEVKETNNMVEQENLDVRTITIGISLLDCIDSDLQKLNDNIYNKITTVAKDLASVGEKIEREFGIPIVNKRISVTPIALVGGAACKKPEDFATIADTMDRDPFHSDGTLPHRARVQFGKPCVYQDRYQHGCGKTDGRDFTRSCGTVQRP